MARCVAQDRPRLRRETRRIGVLGKPLPRAGNDLLQGGSGDSTYRFNVGDGQDTIDDSQGFNTVVFGDGITPGNVVSAQGADGSSLVLSYGNGDSLTIRNGAVPNRCRSKASIKPLTAVIGVVALRKSISVMEWISNCGCFPGPLP